MSVLSLPSPQSTPPLGGLLGRIGNTPMVRLDRITDGLVPDAVEVWVKCEWFNPGGSVKARAALAMVLDAERRGLLRPGQTILDASSGNTGIAYALIAAARGYKLKLCLPANASAERKAVLRAYGAEIIEERIVDVFDEPEGGGGAAGGPKGSEMHGLVFESGRRLAARYAMVSMGLFRVYNDLARQLGAELEAGPASEEKKHVLVEDSTSETSVTGLFCVGDMAKRRDGGPLMKQVYTAQEYAVRAVDTLERRARAERRRALLAGLD